MRNRRVLAITAVLITGCSGLDFAPLKGYKSLVLKPQVVGGTYETQTATPAYTSASINHLVVELKIGNTSVGSKTLSQADLAQSIVFSNLKVNTSYTVQGYAYSTGDDSTKISLDDQSNTTITVNTDDAPAIGILPVKLMDRLFNGQATASGVAVTAGGFYTVDPAAMQFINQGVVTTLAGNASTVFTDGQGVAATFKNPWGLKVDGSGNIYVADLNNARIRKISASGLVSTIAGNGATGYSEGTGTAATLNLPFGVAFDTSGNLYFPDAGNSRVRKINPSGVVSTFAGNGIKAVVDGTGTSASFNSGNGIVIDAANNLYVTDNNTIRKITPAGVVSTLAGNGATAYANGQGTMASFYNPIGMAVDATGNIYVADRFNQRIRKVTPAGLVSTVAGNGSLGTTNGVGTAASFNWPCDVAVDGCGNIFVADENNHLIRKIDPNGVVTTLAGRGVSGASDGTGTAATFWHPTGIAVDRMGNLYVSDYSGSRIRVVR